jgi:hypothetical protein
VTARAIRTAVWTAITAVVVLGARSLGYALAPQVTPLSLELQHSAGGPRLVVVVAVAVGIALGLSVGILGIAALAVRERAALESAGAETPPRLRLLRLAARYGALLTVTCAGFALLESYVHWRAGLGWHGLHCLVGPMHRDAIPLLAALSLVGVALFAAVEHLVGWARRTLARLGVRRVRVGARTVPLPLRRTTPHARPLGGAVRVRGPPDWFASRAARAAVMN